MIHSARFENYRGFKDFSLNNLERVNLLVGKNNSCKTSILEGLHFLHSGSWAVLSNQLNLRGWTRQEAKQNQWFQFFDIKGSLFNIYQQEKYFSISTKNSVDFAKVKFELGSPLTPDDLNGGTNSKGNFHANDLILYNFLGTQQSEVLGLQGLRAEFSSQKGVFNSPLIPLFNEKEVRMDTFNHLGQVFPDQKIAPNTHFITASSTDSGRAVEGWSKIAFDSDQISRITGALQLLEVGLEGIQLLQPSPVIPASFFIKLKGINTPFPLSALGDGTRRLLYLMLAFAVAKDGLLFIDEIDSGIHYTMMEKMWSTILQYAKEFNVQVFATTHSLDCVNGLASVCAESPDNHKEVTIQRIENTKNHSIHYSSEEIIEAAEYNEEMR